MGRVIMARGEARKRIGRGEIAVVQGAGKALALNTTTIAERRDAGSNVDVLRTVDGKKQKVIQDVTFSFVINAFEPALTIRTE
jgi:hypothetical protein